jgi:hypothetical protein
LDAASAPCSNRTPCPPRPDATRRPAWEAFELPLAAPHLAAQPAPPLLPEASALSDADDLPAAAIAARVEEFLLTLPLGTGAAAAEVEAAVSRRLLDAELSRVQLKARLKKW